MRSRRDARPQGAPAPSGMRSIAVASQDHQRSVAMRRRDERRTMRLSSSRALRGRAERDLLEQSAVFLSPMSALQHITDSSQTSARSPKSANNGNALLRLL